MRTLFLAIFCLFTTGLNAAGAATTASQIRDAAASFVEAWADQQSNQDLDIRFTIGSIDSRLTLAACTNALETSFTNDPLNTTSPSVMVSCVGERPWRMFVTTSVEVHGPALVAARPLARGERLSAALVQEKQVQINASRRGILTDPEQISGMLVRRPVNAGSPITPDLLEAPNAVERGDHVIIIAKSEAFSVSSRGKALSSASVGEQVLVENLRSSRTVRATVTAPGRVEIPM
ncbi:flagellar basal body P-ring formation chaperone FlgA [Marinobacter sp.]|uniref:flagellar basal body P-ring formation chaperone FlgA n=1 Tax=Marinobacter sp. TaxID=50741 RepID=UPI001A00C35D|nr:flagellar basal body P-ring formation chaperone FlgA [Marinobacter sp.]MBE0487131.1 flagellar basal body P-ring formation protein FlgA [Marinobacter sp.]